MTEEEKKVEQATDDAAQAQPEGSPEGGGVIEGVEGAEGAAVPAKSGKKKKIIIALVVILLIAGGVTGFMIKKQKDQHAAEEAEAAHKAESKPESIFHDMDDMIINLNTEGKNVSFMKIKMTLEIAKKDDLAEVQKMMPKITDVFQMYMRELRPSDLQGSVGLYRLKEELLLRINKIVHPAQVNDILFKEVLVQ